MPDCSKLAENIARIALHYGSMPEVKNLSDVVSKIQEQIPEATREYVVDSIVEASKGQTRQRSELTKKLNALKTQARRESIPFQKEKLLKDIKSLEDRIAKGDILPKARPEPIQSKELDRIRYNKQRLQNEIRTLIYDLKPKSVFEKYVAEPFNAARAVMTSYDLSAPFRQGAFIVGGNPVRGAKAMVDMFKALSSDMKAHQINESILTRDNAPLYAKSDLYLAPLDSAAKLAHMEEAYMTRLIDKLAKIPGIGYAFKGVKASERAYITFLNKLRSDTFDAMVRSLSKNGEATMTEMKAIAQYINEATGRGTGFEKGAAALNTAFFAPKYAISRFQLLLGHPLWGGTLKGSFRARKLIAKEYAKFLIGIGVVYALGKVAGGEVEEDPRSSDFGKIRFGKTRLDPLAGLSQATVLMSRLISGTTKTEKGKVVPIRKHVFPWDSNKKMPYRGDNMMDIGTRFLRTKLSPMFSSAIDTAMGEDVVGQPTNALKEAGSLVVPLTFGDIYDAMKEQGIPRGAILSLLATFGMGLMTYQERAKKPKKSIGFKIR